MRKLGAFIGMLVVGNLIASAHAAVTTTDVVGTNGRSEQTCVSPIAIFSAFDCTVSGWADLNLALADTQAGPLQSGGFYANGTEPTPVTGSGTGDGKANLAYITGSSISIDDSDTPGDASDDLISFTLVLESGVRNTSTSGGSFNESWESITHTLVNYVVDSTSANGLGGTDYVIGSAGMMFDICTDDAAGMPGSGGCFGESEVGSNGGGVNPWTRDGGGPAGVWSPGFPLPTNVNYGGAGVNNNVGAVVTTVIDTYACDGTEFSEGPPIINECDVDGSAANWESNDAVWDNLIMTISTDDTGTVVEAKGYYVQMYDIILGGDNSWIGGSFSLEKANVLPVAEDDPINPVAVNVTSPLSVLLNDSGLDDVPITVNVVTPPLFGTAIVTGSPGNPGGINVEYTYTDTGIQATDSFTYNIVDGTIPPDTSNTATVTVQITNEAPVAADISSFTTQDTPLTGINVLATPGDLPIQLPIVISAEVNGTAAPQPDNTITFTPGAGLISTQGSFDYTITDYNGDEDTGTVTVFIGDPNIPVTFDFSVTTDKNVPFNIDVLGASFGLSEPPIMVNIVQSAQNGTATVDMGPPESVNYVPNNDFAGTDSFRFSLTDSGAIPDTSNTSTVTVIVNDFPVAANVSGVIANASSQAISRTTSIDVLVNSSGLVDTPLTVNVTQPGKGSTVVTDSGDGTPASIRVDYTPAAGELGTDSFDFTITDANGDPSGTATVNLTINDLPTANSDIMTVETGASVDIPVLDNDSGLSDTPITVSVPSTSASGSMVSVDTVTNIVTYVNNGSIGVDTFNYTVTDGSGDSDDGIVILTVSDPNVPFAADDSAQTGQGSAVTINILANDAGLDDTPITVTEESAPNNGRASITGSPGIAADISVTYTPDASFTGTDSFVYRVTDNTGDTNTATVTINVIGDEIVISIPSGGSSLGPWSLALLLIIAAPVLRRRWSDSIH